MGQLGQLTSPVVDQIARHLAANNNRFSSKELVTVLAGANDVFVITLTGGREVLFPVIPDCVKDIDTDGKKITVHVMKGLLD